MNKHLLVLPLIFSAVLVPRQILLNPASLLTRCICITSAPSSEILGLSTGCSELRLAFNILTFQPAKFGSTNLFSWVRTKKETKICRRRMQFLRRDWLFLVDFDRSDYPLNVDLLDAPLRSVFGWPGSTSFSSISFCEHRLVAHHHALPITLPLLLAWSARCHERPMVPRATRRRRMDGVTKTILSGLLSKSCNCSNVIKDDLTGCGLDIDHVGRSILKSRVEP